MTLLDTDTDTATLLDPGTWSGSIFSGGWRQSQGGDAAVVAPATGEELERIGIADPQDVSDAAARAAEAQREWAATGFEERAAIVRKAGLLWEEHAAEIEGWIVRESGSIPPKAGFEVHVATQETLSLIHI